MTKSCDKVHERSGVDAVIGADEWCSSGAGRELCTSGDGCIELEGAGVVRK